MSAWEKNVRSLLLDEDVNYITLIGKVDKFTNIFTEILSAGSVHHNWLKLNS